MNDFEQEVQYRLLKVLNDHADLSQRDMARKMGVSLGKVNFCIAELAKRGLIKINHFKDAENKSKYLYVLTPRGLEAKAKITISFLRRKMSEYDEIRQQLQELANEAEAEGILDGLTDDARDRLKQVL